MFSMQREIYCFTKSFMQFAFLRHDIFVKKELEDWPEIKTVSHGTSKSAFIYWSFFNKTEVLVYILDFV